MTLQYVSESDPEVADVLRAELGRQRTSVELIASENFTSPAVMEAMGSVLTNKYAEGYPGKRYYGGCEKVDIVEDLARDRACKLYGAQFANVQPHSGANANLAAYFALIKPGDTILGMGLDNGGHLTHGSPANFSGKLYHAESYGVDPETEVIDYDALLEKAKEVRPKVIVGGASAYPRTIDFPRMAEIAHEVGAYLMVVNARGEEVYKNSDLGVHSEGTFEYEWDAKDSEGNGVEDGQYRAQFFGIDADNNMVAIECVPEDVN